jgi:gamma-glutamylcyclotransferase (GGCT)/AIG2-like uncharacterized protein YtfP/lysophospholipase L1-like esterase
MARVFVYGTLMRGQSRAHVLRDQKFLGVARTEPHYQLYDAGTYPAMVRAEAGVVVEGEVWEISPECLRILDGIEAVPDLYQRELVRLQPPAPDDVQAYLYRRATTGMTVCGGRWSPGVDRQREAASTSDTPLFVAQQGDADFSRRRAEIDIVCVGDSITGWNNFGPPPNWPYPTYPRFLQLLCSPQGRRIADGGIAGEVSAAGPRHVARYLEWFTAASWFVIGFGTNDLGLSTDAAETSNEIVRHMQAMAKLVTSHHKQVLFLNVPHVNSSCYPRALVDQMRRDRHDHNQQLANFCRASKFPLADICQPLADEHFGDAVHPNEAGAKIIAETVFQALDPLRRTEAGRP